MNFEKFQMSLTERKNKLEREIKYLVEEDPYKKNVRTNEVLDDAITEIEEHDRLAATSQELKKDLAEVEKALQRIEKGTYGVCVSCGQEIELERLNVMPTATYCLTCQKKVKSR